MKRPLVKLLIITDDRIGPQMAGPAIRACELARVLAARAEVTVTSRHAASLADVPFAVTSFQGQRAPLLAQAREADVLLVQGLVLDACPGLARLGKYLVVDLYDPFVFESYAHITDAGYRHLVGVLDDQMRAGDFFLAASERQRDLYLGRFCALGRLVPETVAGDPAARRLIDVVPFGVPDAAPTPGAPLLRGVVPGVGANDLLLVWGGGIWDWFDPLTVIEAVARVPRDEVRLVFMGGRAPTPDLPAMAMASRALALAEALGVKDRRVFFNPGWVPYAERARYLLEADLGVSAHFDTVETRYAFRTRLLDYLWAGLPILTTEGDALAELVLRERLGRVMRYGDVEGWVKAIATLAENRPERAAVQAVAHRFRWEAVAAPLVEYLRAPYHTPGRRPAAPLAHELRKARRLWAHGGTAGLLQALQRRLVPAAIARKASSRLDNPAPNVLESDEHPHGAPR